MDFINKYNWTKLGLVYDKQTNNVQLAQVFKSICEPETHKILDELILDNEEKYMESTLIHRLESTTRDSNAKIILVFTDSVIAA